MEQKRWKRHYLVRSLILTGFVFLLAELILTDRLSIYLAPRLHMLVYVTTGILVLLTVASIRQMIVGEKDYECDCEEVHNIPRSAFRSLIVYGLFVLPLAMGFVMPDKILGSAMAENIGVTLLSNDARKLVQAMEAEQQAATNQSEPAGEVESPQEAEQSENSPESPETAANPEAEQTVEESAPAVALDEEQLRQKFPDTGLGDFYRDVAIFLYKQPVINLDDKVFLDGLTALELYADGFAGKELETIGFVYSQPDFAPEEFVVARFSVSCCTADANVLGILVEEPGAKKWPVDSWVKVRGKLELRTFDGYEMLVLKASQVQQVEAPKDPYVYYSFDTSFEN